MAAGRYFTIGQLARTIQVPASTIRYYERIGLLLPEDRSQGNYRLYGHASLRRLRFIRAAQSIGFTLDDVDAMIGGREKAGAPCRHVQDLIEQRLAEIENQLLRLRQVRTLLQSSLRKCRATKQARCCHVIEALEARAAGGS